LFSTKAPNATVLWAGIACSPCVNAYNNRQSRCRNNLCMQAITVDRVFNEVSRVLNSRLRTTANRPEQSISYRADKYSLVRVPPVREGQQVAC